MVATIPVHIQAGEPVPAGYCPRCGGDRHTFPLTAILRTGVAPAGSVTICPDCDTPRHVVAKRRAYLERTPVRKWS